MRWRACPRPVLVLVLAALVVSGCADPAEDGASAPTDPVRTTVAPPSTTTVAPTTTTSATSTTTTIEAAPEWIIGAEPLPLRPDGFGEILPTPEPLVERSLPTRDVLPPPPDDTYRSAIEPLDTDTIERMGRTWQEGCPVPLDDLRHLTVTFWGFDGEHHTGELVVHRDAAEDLAWVFGELHAARFPLEEVRLVTDADLDAPITGDGNTTAAFVCRNVRSGSTPSAHAYGLAVDVNPFQNPYVRGDVVIPERASAYLDRSWHRPGMIQPGDVVTRSFDAIGWSWGGEWSSPDHMHLSATGR